MKRHEVLILTGLAAATTAVAIVVVFARADDDTISPPTADSPEATEFTSAGPPEEAAEEVAERVVERMYSFDHTTAGPDAWLAKVRRYLTAGAYSYYHQRIGEGPGATDTEFWQRMVANKGYQYVYATGAHPDPAAAHTNTELHLTLLVPFEVDVQGLESDLPHGDRRFIVNLNRSSTNDSWRVDAVLPITALQDDYATTALSLIPSSGSSESAGSTVLERSAPSSEGSLDVE